MEYIIKGYKLEEQTLQTWMSVFVPERQLLIFKKKNHFIKSFPLDSIKSRLTIDEKNAYMPWMFNKDAKFAALLSSHEYHRIPNKLKNKIIRKQIELNRGLIFKNETFKLLDKITWDQLSFDFKKDFLMNYASEFIENPFNLDPDIVNSYKNAYPYLSPYINTFSSLNGPNCFAAASSALFPLEIEHVIHKWMKQDEFFTILKQKKYSLTNYMDMKTGDLIVWKNKQNIYVHAAYCLDEQFAFNKNSQIMFSPYQLVQITDLLFEWKDYDYQIYRKGS